MRRGHRSWTDDEHGILACHENLTHQELAEMLGRSIYSVAKLRQKVAKGWTNERPKWTPDEDSIIFSAGQLTTNAQLASRIPGRSVSAVEQRRRHLGVSAPAQAHASPYAIAGRPLIAKTCTKCGHLMPGGKFRKTRGRYQSHCNYCRSDHSKVWGSQNPEKRAEYSKDRSSRAWKRRMAALTAESATRTGYPYLEADFEVLADPAITVLGKALRLGRTYSAVLQATSSRGYESLSNRIGQRSAAAWSIDNPNVDRIDEITAALKQEFTDAGIRFPEWDWDDEDLKEAA